MQARTGFMSIYQEHKTPEQRVNQPNPPSMTIVSMISILSQASDKSHVSIKRYMSSASNKFNTAKVSFEADTDRAKTVTNESKATKRRSNCSHYVNLFFAAARILVLCPSLPVNCFSIAPSKSSSRFCQISSAVKISDCPKHIRFVAFSALVDTVADGIKMLKENEIDCGSSNKIYDSLNVEQKEYLTTLETSLQSRQTLTPAGVAATSATRTARTDHIRAEKDNRRPNNKTVNFCCTDSNKANKANNDNNENNAWNPGNDLDVLAVVPVVADESSEASPSSSTPSTFMGLSELALARVLLIIAAALYGTNFSFVKMLGDMDIPVGASSTLRFGLAALATSPWLWLSKMDKPIDQPHPPQTTTQGFSVDILQAEASIRTDKSVLPRTGGSLQEFLMAKNLWSYEIGATISGMEAGMWNSIAFMAQAVGLRTTLASKSAFLCSLAVVVVPLLDRFLKGKKLQSKQVLGTITALAGVAVLELGGLLLGYGSQTGSGGLDALLTFNQGDIASMIQPFAFGMGFWRMETCMTNYPDQANRSTAAQLLAVFLGSLLFTQLSDPGILNVQSITHWLSEPDIVRSLIWTGMVSTALTIYMETIALKTISAAETTLILSTEPLWGSLFAAILMGETFGTDAAVGGLLIIVGCVYSSLGLSGIQQLLFPITSTNNNVTAVPDQNQPSNSQ